MAFEVYHPRRRAGKEPALIVKLSKNSLVLNKVAREKLNTPEYVELAFDTDGSTIRIKPTGKEGGLPIKKAKVTAKPFFEHFKITELGNYVADYNAEENALYVKLA